MLALTLATPAPAKLSGQALLDLCASNLMSTQAVCNAYIEGFVEGHRLGTVGGKGFFCPPPGDGIDQARKIILKYMRKNAASLARGAAELMFQALGEAWPCGG